MAQNGTKNGGQPLKKPPPTPTAQKTAQNGTK
jgi:hypothetical protein